MTSINRLYLFTLLLLSGCITAAPSFGNLSFTTIEQKHDPAYFGQQQYNALTPGLMVFVDQESMADGRVWFSEAARQKTRLVNWETQFVLAVFQGWQSTTGYGVVIEQIHVQENKVQVSVTFQEDSDSATPGVTSPYHLAAVQRPLGNLDDYVVELIANGDVLDTYPTPAAP